jgi:pilus assembly protein TadC
MSSEYYMSPLPSDEEIRGYEQRSQERRDREAYAKTPKGIAEGIAEARRAVTRAAIAASERRSLIAVSCCLFVFGLLLTPVYGIGLPFVFVAIVVHPDVKN